MEINKKNTCLLVSFDPGRLMLICTTTTKPYELDTPGEPNIILSDWMFARACTHTWPSLNSMGSCCRKRTASMALSIDSSMIALKRLGWFVNERRPYSANPACSSKYKAPKHRASANRTKTKTTREKLLSIYFGHESQTSHKNWIAYSLPAVNILTTFSSFRHLSIFIWIRSSSTNCKAVGPSEPIACVSVSSASHRT